MEQDRQFRALGRGCGEIENRDAADRMRTEGGKKKEIHRDGDAVREIPKERQTQGEGTGKTERSERKAEEELDEGFIPQELAE